ncbi:hypothetical protein DFJ74DRAFT_690126 [Hyaloraphidium curvatum]|nr:hypothetical protein DFJ74DRAFT_690126 [Hyaloraphidium curvatum]
MYDRAALFELCIGLRELRVLEECHEPGCRAERAKTGAKPGGKLKTCTQCKSAAYCSAECQKKDHPSHSLVCVGAKYFTDLAFSFGQKLDLGHNRPRGCSMFALIAFKSAKKGVALRLSNFKVAGDEPDAAVFVDLGDGDVMWFVDGGCEHNRLGCDASENESGACDEEALTDRCDESLPPPGSSAKARHVSKILGIEALLVTASPFLASKPWPFFPGAHSGDRLCRRVGCKAKLRKASDGDFTRAVEPAPIPARMPKSSLYTMSACSLLFSCPDEAPLFARAGDKVASATCGRALEGGLPPVLQLWESFAVLDINLRTAICRVLTLEGWKVDKLDRAVVDEVARAMED